MQSRGGKKLEVRRRQAVIPTPGSSSSGAWARREFKLELLGEIFPHRLTWPNARDCDDGDGIRIGVLLLPAVRRLQRFWPSAVREDAAKGRRRKAAKSALCSVQGTKRNRC